MATPNAALPIEISRLRSSQRNPRRGASRTMFLLALTALWLAPSSVASAGVRDDHPNLVGGELLGRGFILTLNYERFLTNQFGLGGGLMAIGTNGSTFVVVPVYASVLTGDKHSLYLSAGGAFVGGGSVHDYESTWVMQASLGYQFHSAGGFFVRPLFTFNQATEGSGGGFLVWPGLTIGGSF
jgi:hypothetical protein